MKNTQGRSGKDHSRAYRWLLMARATRNHIETKAGVLCPLCFELGSGEYPVVRLVSSETACYNCPADAEAR